MKIVVLLVMITIILILRENVLNAIVRVLFVKLQVLRTVIHALPEGHFMTLIKIV